MNNSPTTLQQIRSQLPVRLFNGFGALLEKTRIPSTRMFAADLIETAKRRSGLDDFGERDFFEALSRLLESCQDEARLNLIGKIALKTDVLETLCARLQMEREVSSSVSSTSAVSASRSPMDPESAYSHVCHAGVAVRLSGCVVRADPPDAHRCDGVCVESGDNSTQRV